MVRIAQGVWPDEIQEPRYFTPQGDYRVDDQASLTMKNSLMYKMSYYRYVGGRFSIEGSANCDIIACSFADLFGGGPAQDRVRGQVIPNPGPTLDFLGKLSISWSHCDTHHHIDEAFTSENWIVGFLARYSR